MITKVQYVDPKGLTGIEQKTGSGVWGHIDLSGRVR